MPLGVAATPPSGFVAFCQRETAECGASPQELEVMRAQVANKPGSAVAAVIQYDWSGVFPRPQGALAPAAEPSAAAAPGDASNPPVLTSELARLIASVNDRVNRALVQRTDRAIYGVDEYWAAPLEHGLKAGDCEDFALEKRHALLAAGVPSSALSLAVVLTPRGETHAVLLVATSRGELVLDSLTPWILPWNQTRYRWRARQVAGSASHWAIAAVDLASWPAAPRPVGAPVSPS